MAIQLRRKEVGIVRRERGGSDCSSAPAVRKLLGKLSDRELAKRVGETGGHVTVVRQELGIPTAPRFQSVRITETDLRGLPSPDALFLRERYMRMPPATLPELAKRLGVSKQRVGQRERRALESTHRREWRDG
jgi:hypothetical protein